MDETGETIAECYLLDLGTLLKEYAVAAKRAAESDSFSLGRLMAYHEVISLMQQQAVAFGLPLERLGLHDIDPERDLL